MISDIRAHDIRAYQQARLSEGASPKTVNLELGTLRAILRRNRYWAQLQPDVRMLPTRDDCGHALAEMEEAALLKACLNSRSRSLYPAVVLALSTGMRYAEIRLLRWSQIDFVAAAVKVGKSKTTTGSGRTIPLNCRALGALKLWASQFPVRCPEQFVFPSERYGAAGGKFEACVYDTDPSKPITSWKVAWEAAKRRAGTVLEGKSDNGTRTLPVRFHDLNHRLHPNAGRWHRLPCSGLHHGLERKHVDPHGEALRSHWTGRAATGSGDARWTQNGGGVL